MSSENNAKITILTISIILQLFFGFAINLIWAMMNDLSFIISLGLVSIPIPGVASPIQSLLSSLIYMDLLLTDKWLANYLEYSVMPSELEKDEAMNIYFDSQGFQSKLVLQNLGSTLVFLLMHIFLLLYTGLMGQLSSVTDIAKKQYLILHPRLFWGGTIRFIIQQFQPLIFASLINISSTSLKDLRTKSLGIKFSFLFSLGLFISTLLIVFVFYRIIKHGRTQSGRFRSLIEGLNQTGYAPYWTVWTLLKWSLMCFVLVLLTDYPAQQLQLLLLLSVFSGALQMSVQPQISKVENMMSFFNEVMASCYLYTLIGLAHASDDFALRELLGLVLISLLLFALLVNLLKVLIQIGTELVRKANERCCQSRDNVTVYRKHVRKYAATTEPSIQRMEENIEALEQIENVFDKQLRRNRILRARLTNETEMPSASFSRSMMAQDILISELA
ncbi:hypothetical protein FGO68_gene9232 [Halteria grandinella]|uniref:TRP C-terminal domain-containing protein n=1 Tax=Halteria grandinella TaxID=5974 RepID=A0A8J8T9N9_HALGN|nr:hypothetical protein FGO68_gene9232 [Halteria grandinella]